MEINRIIRSSVNESKMDVIGFDNYYHTIIYTGLHKNKTRQRDACGARLKCARVPTAQAFCNQRVTE